MYKILCLILVVVAVASCEDKNVDAIITDIFGPDAVKGTTPPATIKTDSPCKMGDGSTGKCKPYYLCDINKGYTISTAKTGAGKIDPNEAYECESYLDLCC